MHMETKHKHSDGYSTRVLITDYSLDYFPSLSISIPVGPVHASGLYPYHCP